MGNSKRKIVCCDTINHPTPILLEWCSGFSVLGHEVFYVPVPKHSILEIVEPDIDILIYAGFTEDKLADFFEFKKRYPKATIVIATDHWEDCYHKLNGIVNFFVGAIDLWPTVAGQFWNNGYDYYTIALAANEKIFSKLEGTEKIYDACFIGNLSHGYRYEDKYLYPILDNENYKCFLGGLTYKNYTTGFVPYQQHNIIRNQSKINLNFHVPYQLPDKGEWLDRVDCNQSVFNIALSGNFQLCDHPLAERYFEGNVVVANETNWLELFEYYLNNSEEREEKAFKAMEIAKKSHTWSKRMESFLTIVEKYQK